MLAELSIQNFGLIDFLSLEFGPRLNILTGSTGAGKSIIIDSLRFALGERLKSAQIRDSASSCTVSAEFRITAPHLACHPAVSPFLVSGSEKIRLSRQVLPDGRTKVRINGNPASLNQLKSLGEHLVDLHGPHDHQQLLSEEYHLDVIDRLTPEDFRHQKSEYLDLFHHYTELRTKHKNLQELARSRERDLDLLGHQIRELESVVLTQEACEENSRDQLRVRNAEKLYASGSELLSVLEEPPMGIIENVLKAFRPARQLAQVDDKAAGFEEQLSGIQEAGDQLVQALRDYLSSLSFEPEEAREIDRIYDLYEDIKKKYGPTIQDAADTYTVLKERYDLLQNLEHNDTELQEKIESCRRELDRLACGLTKKRQATARNLTKTAEKELTDLGMKQVKFEVRFETADFGPQGRDRVVFFISPNVGEGLKPLAEIVSSGEAARLMLALKKALTKVDPVPVLIFDEIDAQIGGRLGTVTGRKLDELAGDRQVILITHLPQIAAFAHLHFRVSKKVDGGRTLVRVEPLDREQRIEELAHMMGDRKSGISRSHAQELLELARSGATVSH